MAKEKKPIEDIPVEENVITPDEFEEIEKKEKKGKLGKIFSAKEAKKEEPEPARKKGFFEREKETSQDRLVLDIEKIQAKLETNEGLRQATDEKMSRISEEIGELRSAILEKERTFNRIETGFERMKEVFEESQPKKIRAELDRKEEAIEKIGARVEAFEAKIAEVKKNMNDVISIMDRIKDLKNMVAVSENITKKMTKIEEDKKDSAKTAAKIESMFSELSEKMAEFHKYKGQIEFSSESMHDLMKSMDMLEVKVENALTKDDARKMDDRLEQLESDITAKIQTVRDIVDDLADSLKKGGVKELLAKEGRSRIDEINRRLSEAGNYEKSIKSLREEMTALKEEKRKEMNTLTSEIGRLKQEPRPASRPIPEDKARKKARQEDAQRAQKEEEQYIPVYSPPEETDISSMIEQCHAHIDKGEIDQAKSLYSHILSLYEGSKEFPGTEKAYGRIKRLYYRLQIYQ